MNKHSAIWRWKSIKFRESLKDKLSVVGNKYRYMQEINSFHYIDNNIL
jgi:hypothetical protein